MLKKLFNFITIVTHLLISCVFVYAEVMFDGTTGGQILQGPVYEIEASYGSMEGTNLFHSFDTFSLNSTETAIFKGSDFSIHNIINRVTGGEPSTIDGLLQSEIEGANVFFFNPSGVLFGENAQIDVKGSFYVSNSDYLSFGEDKKFSATQPETIVFADPPVAFGFYKPPSSSIEFNNSIIENNSTIEVIGGDIDINNTVIQTFENGNINLISNSAEDEVQLSSFTDFSFENLGTINISNSSIRSSYDQAGDINIIGSINASNNSVIDSSGNQAGNINIKANNFDMNNSRINTTISGLENNGSSGIIHLDCSESITLDKNSSIIQNNKSENEGDIARFISFSAKNMMIKGASNIASVTSGKGKAGDIKLDISDSIEIIGATIQSGALGDSSGDSGDVSIESSMIQIKDGSEISTQTQHTGKGGNITLIALNENKQGTIKIENELIDSDYPTILTAGSSGDGQPGNIYIESNEFILSTTLNNLQQTRLSVASELNASGIIHIIGNNIEINNATIDANSYEYYNDNNQDIIIDEIETDNEIFSININTDSLIMSGANIKSNTYAGKSEGIRINSENINAEFSSIDSNFYNSGSGDGIFIDSSSNCTLIETQISAITDGTGNSGGIFINKDNENLTAEISFAKSSIKSSSSSKGNAGDIIIKGIKILSDHSVFQADLLGEGDAGEINLICQDLDFKNESQLTSRSTKDGNASLITISADDITFSGSSFIGASTSGNGNAGNIIINSNILKFDRAHIRSESTGSIENKGNAGDISIINSLNIEFTNGASISTKTITSGNAGNIKLESDASINFSDAKINSNSGTEDNTNTGGAGNIEIKALNIVFRDEPLTIDEALISAETYSEGNGAKISLEATENCSLYNINIKTDTYGSGNSEGINIKSNNLILDSTTISSNTHNTASGGNIQIQSSLKIIAESSRIEAMTVGEGNAGNISIEGNESVLSFDSSTLITRSNNVGNAGEINISCDNITLKNKTRIETSTLGKGQGGDVILTAKSLDEGVAFIDSEIITATSNEGKAGNVSINSNIISFNKSIITAGTRGQGDGGIIDLNALKLSLENKSTISTTAAGEGDAGDISIEGDESVLSFDNSVLITSSNNVGNAGNINIACDNITLKNETNIETSTSGKGLGGDVILIAKSLDKGVEFIDSKIVTGTSNEGKAGNVTINSNIISFNKSEIKADTSGQGNAGNIELNAESLSLENESTISSTTEGDGDGGIIDLIALTLSLKNESTISSSSTYQTNDTILTKNKNSQLRLPAKHAGNINLNIQKFIELDHSFVKSEGNDQNAGNISIINKNSDLSLNDNSKISTSSFGSGDSGKIEITAHKLDFYNSSISSESKDAVVNESLRKIAVSANSIDLYNSQISTLSKGISKAGDISINVDDTLSLNSESVITSSNQFEPLPGDSVINDAGNIFINVNTSIKLEENSKISTNISYGGGGNGGNIYVKKPEYILMKESVIETSAKYGNGGNIDIDSDQFIKDFYSTLDVSSLAGSPGRSEIETLDTDVGSDILIITNELFSISELLQDPCSARNIDNVSRITPFFGKDGISMPFDDWLPSSF